MLKVMDTPHRAFHAVRSCLITGTSLPHHSQRIFPEAIHFYFGEDVQYSTTAVLYCSATAATSCSVQVIVTCVGGGIVSDIIPYFNHGKAHAHTITK
jgi:hypothetical protein